MHIELRAYPRSLAAAALKHGDPLRIFRILNHVSPWSQCSITLTKPDERTTRLVFSFTSLSGQSPDILPCLDGVVPEVFDCDSLEFDAGEFTHQITEPRNALDRSGDSLLLGLTSMQRDRPVEDTCLTVTNYRHPSILPKLTSVEYVVSRLRADTLILCGNAALGDRAITVSLLADKPHTLRRRGYNRTRLQELKTRQAPVYAQAHRFEESEVTVDLLMWVETDAWRESRLQVYAGAVPVVLPYSRTDQKITRPLHASLDTKARAHLGLSVEVAAPDGLMDYELDHSLVPDANYLELFGRIDEWMRDTASCDEVGNLHACARDRRDELTANDLEARQNRLRSTRMVYYRGAPLLQEPRSEKDVLALYFKLEGAGALPVESCCVLEHTPARGTDAIGHFRISSADAPNPFALIEFEHRFANFLAHGHSARHVDLIICWSGSTKDSLRPTKHRWLMSYTADDIAKTVPVILLGSIPGLEIR